MDNNKGIVEIRLGGFILLTIAFIVLKLTGVITWSWWLVFLPMIIPWGLVLLLLLIVGIVTIFR
jgi:hypothetical protein